ncbi:MAG: C_GCAxxG_C_C family protein [Chloroflexi bacterium]|nr:C_GCAxxG_C_C family protein [Chloroflexota bacterium]
MDGMEMSRRQALTGIGGVVFGFVAGSGLMSTALSTSLAGAQEAPMGEVPSLPWPYPQLDPEAAAERAYAAYYAGGCMYGAHEGLIGELRETVGFPYTVLPTRMMEYGKAGVVGWGTLCGALNGASGAIYVASNDKTRDKVIDELYGWYGQEALPTYRPQIPKFEIDTSTATSPLCHVSVTRWCNATGFKALSPERAERCAWLTASVAKYTVELLNEQAGVAIAHAVPAAVTQCLACHGRSGVKENVHANKMIGCAPCHDPAKHPGR